MGGITLVFVVLLGVASCSPYGYKGGLKTAAAPGVPDDDSIVFDHPSNFGSKVGSYSGSGSFSQSASSSFSSSNSGSYSFSGTGAAPGALSIGAPGNIPGGLAGAATGAVTGAMAGAVAGADAGAGAGFMSGLGLGGHTAGHGDFAHSGLTSGVAGTGSSYGGGQSITSNTFGASGNGAHSSSGVLSGTSTISKPGTYVASTSSNSQPSISGINIEFAGPSSHGGNNGQYKPLASSGTTGIESQFSSGSANTANSGGSGISFGVSSGGSSYNSHPSSTVTDGQLSGIKGTSYGVPIAGTLHKGTEFETSGSHTSSGGYGGTSNSGSTGISSIIVTMNPSGPSAGHPASTAHGVGIQFTGSNDNVHGTGLANNNLASSQNHQTGIHSTGGLSSYSGSQSNYGGATSGSYGSKTTESGIIIGVTGNSNNGVHGSGPSGSQQGEPGKYTGTFGGSPGILGHQEKEGYGVHKQAGGSHVQGSFGINSASSGTFSNAGTASGSYSGLNVVKTQNSYPTPTTETTGIAISTGTNVHNSGGSHPNPHHSAEPSKYTGSFGGAPGILGHQEKGGYGVHKETNKYGNTQATFGNSGTLASSSGHKVTGSQSSTGYTDGITFDTNYNHKQHSASNNKDNSGFSIGVSSVSTGTNNNAGGGHYTGGFGGGPGILGEQTKPGYAVPSNGQAGIPVGVVGAGSNNRAYGSSASSSSSLSGQKTTSTHYTGSVESKPISPVIGITFVMDNKNGASNYNGGSSYGTSGSGSYGTSAVGSGLATNTVDTQRYTTQSNKYNGIGVSSTTSSYGHGDYGHYSGSFGGGPGILGNQKPGYAIKEHHKVVSTGPQVSTIKFTGSQAAHGNGHYSGNFGGAPGIIVATGPAQNHPYGGGKYGVSTSYAGSGNYGSSGSYGTSGTHGSYGGYATGTNAKNPNMIVLSVEGANNQGNGYSGQNSLSGSHGVGLYGSNGASGSYGTSGGYGGGHSAHSSGATAGAGGYGASATKNTVGFGIKSGSSGGGLLGGLLGGVMGGIRGAQAGVIAGAGAGSSAASSSSSNAGGLGFGGLFSGGISSSQSSASASASSSSGSYNARSYRSPLFSF